MSAIAKQLREAVTIALGGDWQGAHEIAQKYEQDEHASWLHAVVHRMEGDLGNASYWYRRCGREEVEPLPTDAELRQIRDELNEG